MYQIENFELSGSRVAAFQLKAGCVIRVTAGRLWLTLQGCAEDVWLQAGEQWSAPLANAMVWISAEPAANFQKAQPVAIARPHSSGSLRPFAWKLEESALNPG